jgi:hypothetical protein
MKLQFAILLAGLLSLSVAKAKEEHHDGPIGHGGGDDGSTPVRRAVPYDSRYNSIHYLKRRAVPFGGRSIKFDDSTPQSIVPAQYRRAYDDIRPEDDYQSTVGSKPPAAGIGLPPRTNRPPGGGAGRTAKRDLTVEDYMSPRDDYQSQTGGNPGPGHWLPPPDPKARSGGGVRSGKRDLTDEDSADYAWLREDYQSKTGEPKQGGSPGHFLPAPTGKPPGCNQCRTGKRDLADEDASGDVLLRSDFDDMSSDPRNFLPPPTGMRPVRGRSRFGKRDLVDMQDASDYVLLRDLVQTPQSPPREGSSPGGGPDDGAVENPGGRRDLAGEESTGDYVFSRDDLTEKPPSAGSGGGGGQGSGPGGGVGP